jgi:hypothetical protein
MENRKNINKIKIDKYLVPTFLLVYFLVNLLLLTDFPYVHSDEAWLSGLSRIFINEFKMEYTFFNLFPTTHHTMKIFFMMIQGLFIKGFGYNIFTLRLVSLIFSIGSLLLFHKILLNYNIKRIQSLLYTILLAINLQWLMVSHIARQEAVLIFIFLLAYYILLKNFKHEVIILSLILGFGIGIHPNIFFLAIALGLTYLILWINKERKIKDLIKLITLTGIYATIYLITTFYLNPNFLNQYSAYGSKLGVFNQLSAKFQNFYFFYYKLYHRISGTYFTVPLKYDYLAFIALVVIIIYLLSNNSYKLTIKKSNDYLPVIFFIGMNLGILILGRYNQISIIFPIIFLYLSFAVFTSKVFKEKKWLVYLLCIIVVFQGYHSYTFLKQQKNENYNRFLDEFSVISAEGNILGNLNLEYKFKERLIDYRNLTHLEENKITFEEYIEINNIKYIVWYEEMDYIYRNEPKWDILYGPLNYYNDITNFLKHESRLIKTFQSPTYAMRIAKYVNTYPWEVKIYKIKEGSID